MYFEFQRTIEAPKNSCIRFRHIHFLAMMQLMALAQSIHEVLNISAYMY